MKKLIVLMFGLLLVFSAVFAQQNMWQENGIPIRKGVNIEWYRSATSLPNGDVVYAWSDTRNGDRDVWAQRVDNDGNLIWGEEAILVNGLTGRQEDPVVISNSDGSVTIAWVDFRDSEAGDVYSQKLNSAGVLQWDESGVPLCLADDVQISLNIVPDGANGAYVIWLDSRNPGGVDIYGTRVTSSGNIATGWGINGNPIAAESGSQNSHTFWNDNIGGAVVFWHDTRIADDDNIYAQRMTGDGSLVWQTGGLPICDAEGIQIIPKAAHDGDGNFVVCWRDKRNPGDGGDIYAQRLDTDGNFLWTDEVQVAACDSTQKNPRITSASDDAVFVTWEDNRFDPQHTDIFAQKVSSAGNLLWDSEGLPISVEQFDQDNPRLVGDSDGGCFFIWKDGRDNGHPNEDIAVQHVNSSGSILWEENGKIICDSDGEQFAPLLRFDNSNKIYAIWGDNRDGSTGLYLQILDGSGNEYLEQNGEIVYYGLCGNAENYQLCKLGNEFLISWEDSRYPISGKRIFMQTLQPDGEVVFAQDGIPITDSTGFDQFGFNSTVSPNNDKSAFCWTENREGYNQIYAQGIDLAGNQLWGPQGTMVGNIFCEQINPYISAVAENGEVGYYVGWSDFRDFMNSGIFAQKIVNGEIQWDEEGVEIANPSNGDVLTDVVERFFVWQNEDWPEIDIYVQLVDEDGNVAPGWDDEGLLVCGADGKQTNAKAILVPDGLLVFWEDLRNATPNAMDIYAQLIDYDGNFLWETDGIPVANFVNDQRNPNFIYDEEIYVAWQDFRNGTDDDSYIQKLDLDGNKLWAPEGNPIVTKPNDQIVPVIQQFNVSSGDFTFAMWEDFCDSLNADIYAQKIDSDGSLVWQDDFLICGAIRKQTDPVVVKSGDRFAVSIWNDSRASGKADIYNIYSQKIEVVPNAVDDPSPQNSPLLQNHPNPFDNSTLISYSLPNNMVAPVLKIYNLRGQLVRQFPLDSSEQQNVQNWNGTDSNNQPVSSGIYFYKIQSENQSTQVMKMMLVR